MLPRLDGFSVLRKIRKESDVQIIMLTARDYIGDKLAGLTNGADDYITKPFETEELLARIEIAKRHGQRLLEENQELRVADLIVDIKKKRVSENGIIIPLAQREFDLLVVLMNHENEPCTRDYLLDTVWGIDFEGQPNILDVYIKNLRNKLDQNEDQPKLIHTIRGTGYMLSANVSNN
ncbi:DNA-binding response regulator [Fructobacillus cardui]|nr:DNA-binding response regulator [Fructobacillus cardui]